MLIPRFSMRLLLLAMTACAVYSYVLLLAIREHVWAIAMATGVASIAIVLAAHAFTFSLAWCLAIVFRVVGRAPQPASPFAGDSPPPQQIIPPEDVE